MCNKQIINRLKVFQKEYEKKIERTKDDIIYLKNLETF